MALPLRADHADGAALAHHMRNLQSRKLAIANYQADERSIMVTH